MSAENASLPSAGGPQPPASLTCVICAMLIEGAVSTSCGHEFCCACLLTYIELPGGDPTNRPCPVCRARIQYAHPSYGMRRLAAEFADDPRTDEQVAQLRLLDARLPRGLSGGAPVARAAGGLMEMLRREWDDLTRLLDLPLDSPTALKSWGMVLGVCLYVVLPFDLVPDWVLPGVGLIDDLLICLLLFFLLRGFWREYQRNNQY